MIVLVSSQHAVFCFVFLPTNISNKLSTHSFEQGQGHAIMFCEHVRGTDDQTEGGIRSKEVGD